MSMHGGPTDDPTVRDLPLSDPRCNSDSCLEFKAAHEASQAAVSYADQFRYGYYISWFYLGVFVLAVAYYASRLYANRRPPAKSAGNGATSLTHKLLALSRSFSYRRIRGRVGDYLGLPAMGVIALILVSYLVSLLMSFIKRPYYRERRGYGSPPLGVRTGLMATALTPLIVALAGKVNIVTMMTGIDHAKLNALHRHTSYLCLLLSVIHTVPFLVAPYQLGGAAALRAQYYKKPKPSYEYTGTPPLGILVGLCVLSIPWIRNRAYNVFYRLHIPMYIIYLGLMFWHAGNQRDSWMYLWATMALWFASLLGRMFVKWQTFNLFRPWFHGSSVVLTPLAGDMTKIDVLVDRDFRWKPSQHCWLRFPHLSLAQNHPFTIASLPEAIKPGSSVADYNTMTFYARSYSGLTRALKESAAQDGEKALTVHIDGPYGGLVEDVAKLYDSAVFVAGGGGISACLPMMLHLARQMHASAARVANVHLVWMVRQKCHLEWVAEELKEVQRLAGPSGAHIKLFVTDSKTESAATDEKAKVSKEDDIEIKEEGASAAGSVRSSVISAQPEFRRPFLGDLLPDIVSGRRVLLFGCGPESLKIDISNAAAKLQRRVLNGEADKISLHTETFGW